MLFLDTNSHLTTKPYNFDIKCQCNSESYDHHGFCGTKFRGGQSCCCWWKVFSTKESTLWLTDWTSSYVLFIIDKNKTKAKIYTIKDKLKIKWRYTIVYTFKFIIDIKLVDGFNLTEFWFFYDKT